MSGREDSTAALSSEDWASLRSLFPDDARGRRELLDAPFSRVVLGDVVFSSLE